MGDISSPALSGDKGVGSLSWAETPVLAFASSPVSYRAAHQSQSFPAVFSNVISMTSEHEWKVICFLLQIDGYVISKKIQKAKNQNQLGK